VTVEVDPREVDALIERGYLEPNDRDDREALVAANRHHREIAGRIAASR
jgi:hypothetical protein